VYFLGKSSRVSFKNRSSLKSGKNHQESATQQSPRIGHLAVSFGRQPNNHQESATHDQLESTIWRFYFAPDGVIT